MFCFFLDNLPEEEQEVEKERREEKEKKELRKATESRVWGSAAWDRVLSCCDETCRVQPQEFAWAWGMAQLGKRVSCKHGELD